MDADVYQELSRDTATYRENIREHYGELPQKVEDQLALDYVVMGLAGEAAELCNKVKKMIRDGLTADEIRDAVKGEIGDIHWYLARAEDEFGLLASEVKQANLDKLQSRKARGKIGGSGDDR